MNFFVVSAAFIALFVLSSASPFTSCGESTAGKVTSVDVSGCADAEAQCPLVKGTVATITINFTSMVNSTALKARVHGVISGVPIPFSLPQPDACKSGVTCPVKSGENYTYSNKLSIRNSYPAWEVKVKWELTGDDKADIVCVLIPCKIQ